MDLIVESDIYSPSIDVNGNYIDKVPSFVNITNGLRCPCGSRKDKTYDCSSYFSTHIKSKTHQKWLNELNINKTNLYVENIKIKETINNQRLIIAKMEKELSIKSKTIDYLTQQIVSKENNIVTDLLCFD
jgi:hypothetical protein